eukprot:5782867-Pleurochrysis_carterae.AAC.1
MMCRPLEFGVELEEFPYHDIQVGHQQRIGELDDCATGGDDDGVALAPRHDGWHALLSGLDQHGGLGGDAKGEPAHVVEHVL